MKMVGKIIRNILLIIWFAIAVFTTACLLSYNDFKVSTFGKYSLVIIDNDEMEPEYLEGDLLLIKRNSDSKINIGDEVFYYNTSQDSDITIYTDKVQDKETVNKSETTFILNDSKVSGDYVIGNKQSVTAYHKLGLILGILTSKWGYMFLVIFPTLFATVYEIIMIVDLTKRKDNKE